jgi:hypothetical protein
MIVNNPNTFGVAVFVPFCLRGISVWRVKTFPEQVKQQRLQMDAETKI